jgi:hypothetical protein
MILYTNKIGHWYCQNHILQFAEYCVLIPRDDPSLKLSHYMRALPRYQKIA